MPWILIIPPYTERDLRQLPDNIWRSAMETIADLREDPFPEGSLQLEGFQNLYRVRFHGSYRIVYRVSAGRRRVIVERVRPRATAYRGLQR